MIENAYSTWEKMIKSAKERIVVFTPYFDSTLVDLFKLNSDVERILVTCINEEYISENPQQIKAMKTLFDNDVTIQEIDNLHLKVLVSDKKAITVGSQNFTYRGKATNVEATLYVDDKEQLKEYQKQIDIWLSQSEEVTKYRIDLLYEAFANQRMDYKKRRLEKVEEKLEDIWEKVEEKSNEIWKEEKRNEIKLKSKLYEVLALEAKIYKDGHYKFLGFDKEYLFEDDRYKKNLFPLLNLDTLELRFARVMTTRIALLSIYNNDTITKNHYKRFIYKNKLFSKYHVEIEISLDIEKFNVKNANIEVTFNFSDFIDYSIPEYTEIKMYLFFDGFSFSIEKIKGRYKSLKKLVESAFFEQNTKVANESLIASMLLKSFNYEKVLSSTSKTITSFVGDEGYYLLTLVESKNDNIFLTVESY